MYKRQAFLQCPQDMPSTLYVVVAMSVFLSVGISCTSTNLYPLWVYVKVEKHRLRMQAVRQHLQGEEVLLRRFDVLQAGAQSIQPAPLVSRDLLLGRCDDLAIWRAPANRHG